jgi:hypothetical protein
LLRLACIAKVRALAPLRALVLCESAGEGERPKAHRRDRHEALDHV